LQVHPAKFEQARTHEKQGQYEQAEQIYLQIVKDLPGSDDALTAQKNLTILYIGWDKQSQADIALEQLINGFSGHDAIAEALWHIAMKFNNAEKRNERLRFINTMSKTSLTICMR